jgi:hypothetical protein
VVKVDEAPIEVGRTTVVHSVAVVELAGVELVVVEVEELTAVEVELTAVEVAVDVSNLAEAAVVVIEVEEAVVELGDDLQVKKKVNVDIGVGYLRAGNLVRGSVHCRANLS